MLGLGENVPYIRYTLYPLEHNTRGQNAYFKVVSFERMFLISGAWASGRGGGARGGGRGAHLDQDVCKNLGLLWQVDCLLFVLSRSSSIFINELYIIISLLLIESRYFVSVKTSGRNQTAQFLPPSGSVKISCRNQTA